MDDSNLAVITLANPFRGIFRCSVSTTSYAEDVVSIDVRVTVVAARQQLPDALQIICFGTAVTDLLCQPRVRSFC